MNASPIRVASLFLQKAASDVASRIIAWARDEGERVVVNGRTVWAGIGNRAGLHSFADSLVREKWQKSGARFEKLLDNLPEGTVVELHQFRPVDRLRGKWDVVAKLTMPAPIASAMPPALLRKALKTISLVSQYDVKAEEATKYVGHDSLFNGVVWLITTTDGRKLQWSASAPDVYGENGEVMELWL